MSKIQEALRRIKKENLASTDPKRPLKLGKIVEDDAQSATKDIVTATLGTSSNTVSLKNKIIRMDKAALRRAGLLAPEDDERQIIDEYRQIKRPLVAHAFGKRATKVADGNLILVTSALAGEGKTFTCMNLAFSIAREEDRSVLLVDADLVKPHISRLFGLRDAPGLLDLLATDGPFDYQDVIVKTDVPGMSVLASGGQRHNATELLASERMERFVASLSKDNPNRIVLFDSSPLLLTSETRVLSSLVGQVALVVRADHTAQQAVLEAIDSIDENKPVNLILNQARTHSKGSYYGGYNANELSDESAEYA